MIASMVSLAIGFFSGIAVTVILACMVQSGNDSRKEEKRNK